MAKWGEEISDARTVQGVGATPVEMFELESKSLLPLPGTDWEIAKWTSSKVDTEWRVRYDNSYYSVPFRLIGEKVMVRSDARTVRIYYNYELIATHDRAIRKWEYVRNPLHADPAQERVMNSGRENLLSWAGDIGLSVKGVVEKILSDRQVDGLRPARGVLGLAKKYSRLRLEKACARALLFDRCGYGSVKNILEKGLDRDALPEAAPEIPFRFARSKEYYEIH